MTVTGRPSQRRAAYVPVYTLHDMRIETGQIPQVPVILCTGCGHEIPAPRGGAAVQCRDCGKRMQIVGIRPASTTSQANGRN